MQKRFRWTQAYILAVFTALRPHTWVACTSKMHYCKISWLWSATVCSIFTAMEAKYTHLYTSIPVLQQLQPWIDNLKFSFQLTEKEFFSVIFCFVDPAPPSTPSPRPPPTPLDPRCHFAWIGDRYLLTKGNVGSQGGTHSKLNYKTLNEPPNARSQQFFENQLNIHSHNPFVGFSKCIFGRQL